MDLLTEAFKRDDPFTMDSAGEYFFNTKTKETVWCGDGSEYSSDDYQGKEDWIVVPGTHHHEWHEVFKRWLDENGLYSEYANSIGLTLKRLDESYRYNWYEKMDEYASQKAADWVKDIQPQSDSDK